MINPISISLDMLRAFPDDTIRVIAQVKLASVDDAHAMFAAFFKSLGAAQWAEFLNLPEKGKAKRATPVATDDKPKRKRGPNKPKAQSGTVTQGDVAQARVGQLEPDDDEARARLMGYLGSQQKALSAAELQTGCNLTDGQVKGLVRRLLEQGGVVKEGVARGTKYRLAVFAERDANGATATPEP